MIVFSVVVTASRRDVCRVCGGAGAVDIRSADDPQARPLRAQCPHCGDLRVPYVEHIREVA